MWKEIFFKYYSKFLPLIIIIFSLFSTILVLLCINFNTVLIETSESQYLLFFLNILYALSVIILNIKSLNWSMKRNIFISIIIYCSLIINIIITFDFYFIKSDLIYYYSILNILNLLPAFLVFLFTAGTQISENIILGITLFVHIIINNIIITILFHFMKYKNNIKYIILTLYYFQSNSFSIVTILFAYLGSRA